MLFWVRIAARFLIRSGRSTALLTLMVVSAVSALIFLSSLAVGINDAMIRNSVGLFSGHVSGANIPPAIAEKELYADGVIRVLKRVPVSGFLKYGDNAGMLTLIAVAPEDEKDFTAIWKKCVKGRYLESGRKEIFLSSDMAVRLGVEPGDRVVFSSVPDLVAVELTVAGTYRTGMDQFDRGVSFCTLSALPVRLKSWNAAIFLENGADSETVAARYRNGKFRNIVFKSWAELMPELRQLIDLNYVSMSIVIVLVFIVVSIGIACAFLIFILKNLREYGIMKVMGVFPGETAALVFSEVIILNLAASLAGIIAGAAAVLIFQNIGIDLSAYTSHNPYFIVSGVVYPRLTPYSLCLAPASALFFSLPAAIWPSLLVIRKNAADILRTV